MIYVTHDQTEALTFADQVVVMYDGRVVQIGTPEELFETPAAHLRRPLHRLARHERAALPKSKGGKALRRRHEIAARQRRGLQATGKGRVEIGIRPEFVTLRRRQGLPVNVAQVEDVGPLPHRRDPRRPTGASSCSCPKASAIPDGKAASGLRPGPHSTSTPNDWRWSREGRLMDKTVNQKAWFLVLPVFLLVAFIGRHPADDGGQLFGAGHLRQQRVLLGRHRLVRASCCIPTASTARFCRQIALFRPSSWRSRSRSASSSR